MNIKKGLHLIKKDVKGSLIENKYALLLSTLLFIVPLFLGYLLSSSLREFMDPVLNAFKQKIVNGEIKLTAESIFINNFKAILIEYTGATFFGLITVANLILNGLLVGYFGSKIDSKTFLLGITPHGIFEIPGLIIGGTAGFTLLYFIFNFIKDVTTYNTDPNPIQYTRHANESYYNDEYFKRYEEKYFNKTKISKRFSYGINNNYKKLKQSIILFSIATVLLVVAAFIEAKITPEIIHIFS
ncbi:MAG: stage II sporulation protein M [Methanobrevibacter sp.]|nr:stage II sporulation protein M [Candidatus Methanovirga aequatorialis]